MPQLVPQLSSDASSTLSAPRASTSSSSATSWAKDASKPSPFDNQLRDISKPKQTAPKPAAKLHATAKPAARKTTKPQPVPTKDAKKPSPKSSEVPHDSSAKEDQPGDPGSTPQNQTAQDPSKGDDQGQQPDSQGKDPAAARAKASAANNALPQPSDPSTTDGTQPADRGVKPGKKAATATPVTSDAASQAAQQQQQTSKPAQAMPQSAPTDPASANATSQTAVPVGVVKDAKTPGTSTNSRTDTHAAAASALPQGSTDDPADAAPPVADATATGSTSGSTDGASPSSTKSTSDVMDKLAFAQTLAAQQQPREPATSVTAKTATGPANSPASQQAQFTEVNHPTIVSEIQGKMLPDGGAMSLRLNPPELGAMHVRVEVHNGVISASFSAEREQTAKLLSHSLGDLKSSLESQGMTVEKLHVAQAPKDSSSNQSQSNGQGHTQSQQKADADGKEQQRREMLQRMWKKLMKGQDPLDLMA